MARMYSRKRGQSGSTRPTKNTTASWVRYTDKEVETLIVKCDYNGNTFTMSGEPIFMKDFQF